MPYQNSYFRKRSHPARSRTCFFIKLDEDGSNNYFDTDQTKTDTPTLTLGDHERATDKGVATDAVKSGVIHRVHYRLKPTNAVTYQLFLWEAAKAGNYESNMRMIYSTATGQVSDTDYDKGELAIPFYLHKKGSMYYSIDWSGTPGTTQGFIVVSGEY